MSRNRDGCASSWAAGSGLRHGASFVNLCLRSLGPFSDSLSTLSPPNSAGVGGVCPACASFHFLDAHKDLRGICYRLAWWNPRAASTSQPVDVNEETALHEREALGSFDIETSTCSYRVRSLPGQRPLAQNPSHPSRPVDCRPQRGGRQQQKQIAESGDASCFSGRRRLGWACGLRFVGISGVETLASLWVQWCPRRSRGAGMSTLRNCPV